MKILIMSDLEGVAGVLDFENHTVPGGRYYDQARNLLTCEVNAAACGFFEAGAEQVDVYDGHGPGGLNAELLLPQIGFFHGVAAPIWPWQLDQGYTALAFVGQHAMSGTDYSHLTHTGSCNIAQVSVNDINIGEYGQVALCAMELKIPTLLACGEEALKAEVELLTPGTEFCAVKKGLLPDPGYGCDSALYRKSKLSAKHLAPLKAREVIKEAAYRALERYKTIPESFGYNPIFSSGPYRRICHYRANRELNLPRHATIMTHDSSFIAMMNQPESPLPKNFIKAFHDKAIAK